MSLSGIWTAKGIDKLAAQTAGGPVLTIHKIALGDGGGIVPAVQPSQAALLKEVWRGLVNAVLVEPDTPNAVTVEAVIPYSVGGFFIREWGIYDVDGDLIAVGPHAEFYKPLLAEGSGAELLERIQLPLANAGQVNLTISSEALATRKYVDQTATAKAREEVARHDEDAAAHGGRMDAWSKRKITTTAPLTGGGDLSEDRTLGINASVAATADNVILRDAAGRAQVAAPAAEEDIARKAEVDGHANLTAAHGATSAALGSRIIMRDAAGRAQVTAPVAAEDIARKADVDAVRLLITSAYELCEFYHFRHPSLKPGFQPAHGGLIANAATLYPKAWAYLQTVEGQKLCTTEAQWQAMVNAYWHTNADGSRVGWNGIGGAPCYVINTGAGTLRLPDLRGMYAEAAGDNSLGVGGVHGDAGRRVTGSIINTDSDPLTDSGRAQCSGALSASDIKTYSFGPVSGGGNGGYSRFAFDSHAVAPTANKNQPRAWGSLACVCLDPAAS